jgi:sortase (surface protein transpeptidase)
MRDRRVRSAVVAAVLGAALVTGCGVASGGSQPASGTSSSSSISASQPPAAIAEPAELSIPKIGANSTLVGLGLGADNTVEVPPVSTPMQAGWFTGGPRPGEPGPAVILGHVNGNGKPGIFDRLHELTVGDEILIQRTDGTTARFTVRKVDEVPKAQFPTDAVYGDTAGPELRLITCGGSFDRTAHSYRDSVIVYAVPA